MYRVFQHRCSIRKELLELQGKDYDITYRMHCKELRLGRQELVTVDSELLVKVRTSPTACTARRCASAARSSSPSTQSCS